MSPINNLKTIQIFVNGQIQNVFDNQSVQQALLQNDEYFQHFCHVAKTNPGNFSCCSFSAKIENHIRNRDFKACLAPVLAGMNIMTI